MDDFGGVGLGTTSKTSKKRRSNLYRRPTNESECPREYRDSVSLSSTPSDHVSDAPSEGTVGQNLNQCISRASYSNLADAETVHKSSDEDVVYGEPNDLKRSTEDKMSEMVVGGHLSGQSGLASDGIGMRNKLNKVKVKLKVGGVNRTIHAKSSSDGSSVAGTSDNKSTPSEAIYPPHKPTRQENLDLHFTGEKVGLCGVPWKDFSKIGFSFVKMDSFDVDVPDDSDKQSFNHGRLSKSKSINKKYPSVEAYDEEDDDDEIRYLQKIRTSRVASFDNTEYEEESRGKKLRKISNVMNRNTEQVYALGDYDSSRSGKESKKSGSMRAYGDADYMEEDESVSDVEIELKNKKQRKESISISEFPNKESSVTTRRRAILTGKDIATGLGASSIQFPDGLPPAPPRKPQLTEVQQQLKRAEAAQRRKIQNEKAARESEAEAIRKILGQDSSRKRREEKFKKRQEELAQERSVNSARVAPDVVRWVIGPSGTVVTFPDEIGLPTIFEPKPSRYPSPREECAGPSCTNAYKYRDSKSNLPLCSLQCYKAIH